MCGANSALMQLKKKVTRPKPKKKRVEDPYSTKKKTKKKKKTKTKKKKPALDRGNRTNAKGFLEENRDHQPLAESGAGWPPTQRSRVQEREWPTSPRFEIPGENGPVSGEEEKRLHRWGDQGKNRRVPRWGGTSVETGPKTGSKKGGDRWKNQTFRGPAREKKEAPERKSLGKHRSCYTCEGGTNVGPKLQNELRLTLQERDVVREGLGGRCNESSLSRKMTAQTR